MSWEDKMREQMYLREALRANNVEELERGIQNADRVIDGVSDFFSRAGRALSEPSTPPPSPKSSSSGGLGLLVAGAAVAGGAYLLNKVFGSDDKKSSNPS